MPPSDPHSSEAPTRRQGERMEQGSTLGRYVIEGVIGEGGMGVVYKARDARLNRKVAIKVISGSDDDPESVDRIKRFLREARAAAALDHPNAVSIFDVGESDQVSFIAMELVHGQLLRRYVGDGSVPVTTRLGWLADIAAALAAAHRARLIHRDVKPENVMIRDDGRVKVLDFGLARRAPPPPVLAGEEIADHTSTTETGQTTLTGVGTLLGTPQYMAPEQIRSEPLDGRSDQFSWGVVAYELLTGQLPWTGAGLHVMARILTDQPKPLRELCPELPEDAAAVVERALARPADDRFASMDEVIVALEPFLEAAHSGPRSLRARSMPPKPPTIPPPAVVYPTQKSADLSGSSGNRPPTTPPPKTPRSPRIEVVDAPPPPEPRGAGVWMAAALALIIGVVIGWRALQSQRATAAPVASASASAQPPSAVAVTDLPDPKSPSPEAVAAFRAGLVELRLGGTRTAMERAAALDPSMAEAHLMLAVDAVEVDFTDVARAHLRKAAELRASLRDRDQLLLDAVEPILMRQPADWAEAGRRIAKAVERFPNDAQLWYERGYFAQVSEGLMVSTSYFERATALDPSYAEAFGTMAENLAYLGRFDDAKKAIDRCRAIAPAHIFCATELSRILDHEGGCEEEETTARQIALTSPAQDMAQDLLAAALAARNKPEAAVREALKLKWAALSDADRKRKEPEDTLSLAMLSGDFVTAERAAHDLEALVEPSRHEPDHAYVARRLALIYAETGRTPDAGRVAEAFLGRRDAWEPDPRAEDFAMAGDATPMLLAAALKAGKLTRADFTQKRAEWVRAWERKAPRDFKSYVWAHGFAEAVDTPEDAREAVTALAAYRPLPEFYPKTLVAASIGYTMLLAGRLDEAEIWLTRATRSCAVLAFPVQHTRAHLWLGTLREAKGDKEGACAAYRVVRERWGKAKPRSVTAEKAGERMRALSCPQFTMGPQAAPNPGPAEPAR